MKCVQKDLKKCDDTIYMDMNIVTLPKKGLKTRPYSMDVNKDDHIVTLPKKGLKTGPYSMDMNKDDHIVTLPKKGLKTGPYNIGMEKMEKKDLKKLTKGQLIKLLLKQRNQRRFVTMRTCSTTTHLRMKLHKSLQNSLNHQELENQKA